MQGPVSDFNYTGLVGETQDTARDGVFAKTMQGVFSAAITLVKFRAAEPVDESEPPGEGFIYRKFFYNPKGEVEKRLSFDEEGNIEMKEESTFDEKGNILSGRFISPDNIVREYYEYDNKGNLVKYTFLNPKLAGIKYETNEIDEKGRLVKTTSFGFLKTPELISSYSYPEGKNKRYKYKKVTKSDGSLLITFYYTYDSVKEDSNLTGLYGFYLTPTEIDNLLETHGDNDEWEKKSAFRSKWEYNTDGKQTFYERDEQLQPFHLEYGFLKEDERIVTDRSDIFYGEIDGTKYPVKIIDWQTRYMEPCKVIKRYQYSDENGNIINPDSTSKDTIQKKGSGSRSAKKVAVKRPVAKKKTK